MKHKFLAVLLAMVAAFCMAFSVTACDEKSDETGKNPPITDPSGNQGTQGNQGSQGGTQKPDEGEQGGTQKPDDGEQGNTPTPHVHSFGEWKVTKESTCKETGTKERSCACGEKETEALPLAGHDFENMACKVCGIKASLGLEYTLINEDKEYEVSGIGDCKDTDLIITNNYDGKPVTAIGESAFDGCSGLSSVTIPDSVTSIGGRAFILCSGLSSVTIPDSVTSIGRGAFYACNGLTSVTIPENVTEIGNQSFYACENLTTVIWNAKNCKTIRDSFSLEFGLFKKTKLQKVTFGEGILSLPESMFCGCTELTDLVLPETLTSIGEYVFGETDYLENNGEKDEHGVIYLGKYLMEATESFSGKYEIKEGTTVIAGRAFLRCSELTEISIPDSVVSICSSAFMSCRLEGELKIPDNVIYIEDYAFEHCDSLTSVVIGDGVTSIGIGAFYNCVELTSVTIGKNVRSIGDGAFSICIKLHSVEIPDGVAEIGVNAFASCFRLTSVVIPNSVTSIAAFAFWKCTGLTSVTIGNGVTSIGNAVFNRIRDTAKNQKILLKQSLSRA